MIPKARGERILDRWKILDHREGGLGIVYVAWDERAELKVAIKIASDRVRTSEFEREAMIMLGIDPHPNVAMVFEVDRFQGRPLIAMPFYEDDLRALIGSPLLAIDIPFTMRLALQICDGILHVQRFGVAVHADIKPSNLLMTGAATVAVADFGLALAREHSAFGIGTPAYLAPEVAAGAPVSVQSDVYSFGVTFYEMLAGRRPSSGAVEPIDDLPESLWMVVSDCLAENPGKRPQTFAELRGRLVQAYESMVPIVRAPQPSSEVNMGASALVARALGLCRLRRHDEETPLYRRALASEPDHIEARVRLADNLRELGKRREALQEIEHALRVNPQHAGALNTRGSILDELGEVTEAETTLRRAVEKDPANESAWYNLAVLLDGIGKATEALAAYESTTNLDPRNAQAWTNLGCLWSARKEKAQAEECWRKALEQDPCLQEPLGNLAAMLRQQRRYSEVIELMEEVERRCG
jgi:Flp pilus assembly protein TadD